MEYWNIVKACEKMKPGETKKFILDEDLDMEWVKNNLSMDIHYYQNNGKIRVDLVYEGLNVTVNCHTADSIM